MMVWFVVCALELAGPFQCTEATSVAVISGPAVEQCSDVDQAYMKATEVAPYLADGKHVVMIRCEAGPRCFSELERMSIREQRACMATMPR
jgi:hypothetical protein